MNIEEINNNMELMWPEAYLKLKKLINNKSLAILNLLSDGNLVLVVSNRISRTKLFNIFSKLELEHLIFDFEEDINDELFLTYLIEDSNTDFIGNSENLIEKKIYIEKCINSLKNYSNFNLTPFEIKKLRDYHLNKLNNKELIFPINNLFDYNNSTINDVAEDIGIFLSEFNNIFFLNECFSRDFFESEEYFNLVDVSNEIKNNLNDFIILNKKLNILIGLKIFNNFEHADLLENVSVLYQNSLYIDKKDRNDLNEDLKHYFNENNLDINNISYQSIINEYINDGEDIIEKLLTSVVYSELIDNEILTFNIEDNKEFIFNKISSLFNLFKYIKKQLYLLSNFYSKYQCFTLSPDEFNLNNSFESLFNSINIFLNDFNKLSRYNEFLNFQFNDLNVKNYVGLVFLNKVDEHDIIDVFYYNVYKELLDIFLNKYDFISESKLNLEDYRNELRNINIQIDDDYEKQFFKSIEIHVSKLNNDNEVLKQKAELNSKILNDECGSNLDILKKYKEFIFANKRLFLVDESMLPQLSLIDYTQEFDYIVKDDSIEYLKK